MAMTNKKEERTYSYDPNVDYSKLMDDAVKQGDFTAAAQYEQQRNEKIQGEGLTQYQPSNTYSQHMPKTNEQQMQEIMDKILNREEFHYDMDADALYQQYKDKYMKQGALAMQDTMGQAASMTGGYGNSYAQTVGQQVYNQHLGQLNAVVPELYALARDQYGAEGNALLNQYSILADRENTQYSRNAAQMEKAYNLALSMLQSGIMPSQEVLNASGLSSEDAQKIYDRANQPSGSYGGASDNRDNVINFEKINDVSELGAHAKMIANRFAQAGSDQNQEGNFEIVMNAWDNGSITIAEAAYLLWAVGIGDGSAESAAGFIRAWGG